MNKKRKPVHYLAGYAKYSSMAFQMGIIIAGGTYGGIQLDKWLNLKPLFTLICSLGAVAIALYLVIKDLTPKKPKNNGSKNTH
ncbi:MAG: AtpZ/AtpI family protein [Bacteroidales bacterium]